MAEGWPKQLMIWWLYLHLRYTWHYMDGERGYQGTAALHTSLSMGRSPRNLSSSFAKLWTESLELLTWWKIEQAEYPTLLQGGHSCLRENKDGNYIHSIDWQVSWKICRIWKLQVYTVTTLFPAFLFFQGGLDRLYRESKIFVALQAFHQQVEHREA